MSQDISSVYVLPVKDGAQVAIPTAWRSVLQEIVHSFVRGDYRLRAGVPGVEAVSEDTASHIQGNIQSYGDELIELPAEAWDSSVCIWMGNHWDAIVDLWTRAEGRSDLVLKVKVSENENGLAYRLRLVYVP